MFLQSRKVQCSWSKCFLSLWRNLSWVDIGSYSSHRSSFRMSSLPHRILWSGTRVISFVKGNGEAKSEVGLLHFEETGLSIFKLSSIVIATVRRPLWFDVNKHFAHNKTSGPLYARLGGSIELSVFTIFIPPINEFKGSFESRKVDLSKRWGCRNVTDTLKDRWRRYGQILCHHLTFTCCDSRTDLCSMQQPSRADQSFFINSKLNFQSYLL